MALALRDLRAGAEIAVDATIGVIDVAEAVHLTITRRFDPFDITGLATRVVYGTVRAATALIGRGIDAALAIAAPLSGEQRPSARREAVLAVLNGLIGDHLCDTSSPLAIPMAFRRAGQTLDLNPRALAADLPQSNSRILVLVHGLCLNDLQWAWDGEDRGAALAARLNYTPVHLHHNSGLHVSTNGRRFSELLDALVAEWPVPVEELVIVAHSMGGLIARSACHYGARAGCDWPNYLRKIVFLGTPHHGTSLERAGNWIDGVLELSSYSAPLARIGKVRSAGITDLRFGNTRESDWLGRDRFGRDGDCRRPLPLPVDVECFAVAGVAGTGGIRDRLLGDGLVPVESALGVHRDASLSLAIPQSHRWIAHGMGHFDLLRRQEVYETIAGWLST